MSRVIETNISIDINGDYKDFQSRVIEVESWNSLVDEIKSNKAVDRASVIGTMFGYTLPPRGCVTTEHKCDDTHLSCKVTRWDGVESIKLLYLIDKE